MHIFTLVYPGMGVRHSIQISKLPRYNSYSSPGHDAQLLYPTISKVNHSCHANATTVCGEVYGSLICVQPIAEGQEIFASYLSDLDLLRPIRQRRRLLSEGWDFHCACGRCVAAEDDARRFGEAESGWLQREEEGEELLEALPWGRLGGVRVGV